MKMQHGAELPDELLEANQKALESYQLLTTMEIDGDIKPRRTWGKLERKIRKLIGGSDVA